MTPGSFNLKLYRGDSYTWRFVMWSDTAKTIPADLVGVVPRAEIRDKPGGALVVPLVCTVEPPNTVLAILSAAASSTLPLQGSWDLQLTYPDGEVATVVAGSVGVTADVTNSSQHISSVTRSGPTPLRARG
jgi:hypothetical protein